MLINHFLPRMDDMGRWKGEQYSCGSINHLRSSPVIHEMMVFWLYHYMIPYEANFDKTRTATS